MACYEAPRGLTNVVMYFVYAGSSKIPFQTQVLFY